MSLRGRLASDRLTVALLVNATQGRRPNCSDPESHQLWLSEHPAERKLAVAMCSGCCVWDECGAAAAANRESFGVWASRDRTRAPGSKKRIEAA
ncbi:MAG: WhiB family transcriptional regulator [Propionibacteriaceae bacterium]